MFKARNIIDTSGQNMVRIQKRERILSIAIHSILSKVNDKNDPKSVRMKIMACNRDYLNWKIAMIESAQWLTREDAKRDSFTMWMSWKDSNKLRIYHKWLYHNHKFTLKNVLKYMYSPFFPAVFYMERGGIDDDYDCAYLRLWYQKPEQVKLLATWFKDVLDLETTVINGQYDIPCLVFCGEMKEKFLSIIEPIVSQVPSKYVNFRRVSHG